MYEIKYLSNLKDNLEFNDVMNQIYEFTKFINLEYYDYESWFFMKHITRVKTGLGDILYIKDTENSPLVAIASLKNTRDEKKICTLYIDSKYRGKNIGSLLTKESLSYLKTTKPLITFSATKLNYFKKYIIKYNWNIEETIINENKVELVFNGKLTKERKIL